MTGPHSLLPRGILQLWWVTRKAEPPNQTQVPSQARRDLAGTATLIGLTATMPHKHTDFFSETELKSQILAWNKLHTLPAVPTHPISLCNSWPRSQYLPYPGPSSAQPRRWLAPGLKVTRVSCLFPITMMVCHALLHIYDFVRFASQFLSPCLHLPPVDNVI